MPPAAGREDHHQERQACSVPDNPIIPFIEGDGTGPDIWRASVRVMDAAVAKAYGGKRRIHWMEVYAGEKANKLFNTWLPEETVAACREYLVSIKGPLTTPVGGGIRSLNVALRQMLDLYVCLRPVRWFKGVPSPVQAPREGRHGDLPREHRGHLRRHRVRGRHARTTRSSWSCSGRPSPRPMPRSAFPESSGIGIKPVSQEGSERLIRAAIEYAITNKRKSVTLVHKGNIQKFTEGAFRNWGYAARRARVRRPGLHLGAMGAHQGRQGREGRRTRRWTPRAEGRPHHHQGRDRRHHAAAGADAPRRVRRHRDAQPQRRLPLRRARRPGRRHRHRPRRQHQLPHRACGVRGHARHGAQVRQPRQGEPGLGDPLRAR